MRHLLWFLCFSLSLTSSLPADDKRPIGDPFYFEVPENQGVEGSRMMR